MVMLYPYFHKEEELVYGVFTESEWKKTDELWLSDLIKKKNLKASYLRKYHNSFYIDEFSLNIGLRISIHENSYPPGHPAYSYETMFLEHEFVYQESVSSELG
ncbi:hypothetical protein [Paenibacillus planticolens]|nr:hypothetical protein [Paenibacillus planticolens]